jgi:Raf kinase inhibitor-like YbhB/YbcL family protein
VSLQRASAPNPYEFLPPVPSFTVTSEDMRDGAPLGIDHVYSGAGGRNESPQLSWSGAPEGTRGYAVTCLDPDAPTGSGAWHWLLVNLPASVAELPRGAGAQAKPSVGGFHARNDLGGFGYDGAAPPRGDKSHRYLFAVHALDTDGLEVTPETSAAFVGFHITGHTVGRAILMVTYQH